MMTPPAVHRSTEFTGKSRECREIRAWLPPH